MLPTTEAPFPSYFDSDGDPLDGGYIYYGAVYQNPVTSPIPIYWDAAGTQPCVQPVRTNLGFTVRAGTPSNVFAPTAYSISVYDKRMRLLYTMPDSSQYSSSQPLVSVKNFGAIGNGVAVDTLALQAALNSGQPLYVPAGTYMTGPLTVPSGTVLLGAGRNATIFKRINNSPAGMLMAFATNASNLTLENFTLDGNKINNTAGFSVGGFNVSNVLIQNVSIINDVSNGGYFLNVNPSGGSQFFRLQDVAVVNCGGSGFAFGGANNVTISDSNFTLNTGGGVYFDGVATSGILVQDSIFATNGSHGCAVVCITSGNPAAFTFTASNIAFHGNYVINNVGYGLVAEALDACVTGNVCVGNGLNNGSIPALSGMQVTSDRVSVTGNTCHGNAGDGIDMGGSTEFVCSGNSCTSNGYYGIEIGGYQGSVTGNTCTNNFASNPAFAIQCGIYHGQGRTFDGTPLAVQPDRVTISSNTIEIGPHQTFGIWIDPIATNDLIINNNCVTAGNTADIYVGSTSSVENGNLTRWTQGSPSAPIASTTNVATPDGTDYLEISGTTTINQFVTNAVRSGRMLTVLFQSALTLNNNLGSNGLVLAGGINLAVTATSVMTFRQRFDGKWYEQSRAIR